MGEPKCFICGGSTSLHSHHIVPRCYGGEKGPTVWLDADCHGLTHNLADSNTPLDQIGDKKVAYLVGVIYRAKLSTKDDPNRRRNIHTTLTGPQHKNLQMLAHILNLTQEEVILLGLKTLSAQNNLPTKIFHLRA